MRFARSLRAHHHSPVSGLTVRGEVDWDSLIAELYSPQNASAQPATGSAKRKRGGNKSESSDSDDEPGASSTKQGSWLLGGGDAVNRRYKREFNHKGASAATAAPTREKNKVKTFLWYINPVSR